MIGTTLAQFEIRAKLGEGGMGEVWLADDTRLGRRVALKILPADVAGDAERMARFEREAKVLASLNHPNIAHLYGLETAQACHPERAKRVEGSPEARGDDEGTGFSQPTPQSSMGPSTPASSDNVVAQDDIRSVTFLVMELVEGEDLSARIERGALPVDEAVRIALQIAEALEAAHEAGIVHRDLKPANIKLKPDGTVKVLDFGLAKTWDTIDGEGSLSMSPTMTRHATAAGVVIGTAAYMSPEQARGNPVDRRADIWAFGTVLWEMLTGRALFGGDTVSDVMADVLRAEIDLDALPASTPPGIGRLIGRCLERDDRSRLRDIGEARIALESPLEDDDQPTVRPVAPRRRSSLVPWLVAAGAAVLFVGSTVMHSMRDSGPAPDQPRQLMIQLPPDQRLITDGNSTITFHPDGKSLVVAGEADGRNLLLRRELGAAEAQPIAGTDWGQAPFFSPDGRWLGFVSRGKLMKVPVEGGTPLDLADSQGAGGATWLTDNTVVFAPIYSDGLFRVSAEGGETVRMTTPDRDAGELGHWWPDVLPGGRWVVFTAFRTPVDRSRIGVLDLETGGVRWAVDGGFFGRYVDTGHLLYAKQQHLFAVPFDAESGTVTGSPVALFDDLRVAQTGGFGMFAVSALGDLAYVTESSGNPPRELVWIDRDGRVEQAAPHRLPFLSVDLAPDGKQAAVTVQGDSRDLWTYSFDRGSLSRITSSSGTEFDPRWSPDGRELYYVVDVPPFTLYRIPVGSPDSGRPIWDEPTEVDVTLPTVSPDGRWMAFVQSEQETRNNIFVRLIDGSEPMKPFRASRADELSPTFSPDGNWIAYSSDENGWPEIYVEPFPGPGERFQVTANGGNQPLWVHATGEILYRRFDEMWVVETRIAGDRIEIGTPRLLATHPIEHGESVDSRVFDVSSDGERILAVTVPDADQPRRIEFVTDWTAELERLVQAAEE
jgi:serine/threonine-protein kinase